MTGAQPGTAGQPGTSAQEEAHGCGQVASGCGQAAGQAPHRTAAATGAGDRRTRAADQALTVVEVTSRGGSYRPLNHEEMAAWRSFLAAATTVTSSLNRELEAASGISMHEYEILVRLSEAPGRSLRMSDLAEHVSHSRSRLTHTVGRLEKSGYVERLACSSDRRGVTCHLTDAGLAFLTQAAPAHLDGVRRHVLDRVGAADLTEFTRMMERLSNDPACSGASSSTRGGRRG